MKDIINNLKNPDTLKTQLTLAINFMSSKDTDLECRMHSKSDNVEVMINDKGGEIIFKKLSITFSRYQFELEITLRGSSFIFDHVHLLHYSYNKNANRGRSYIDSPSWT